MIYDAALIKQYVQERGISHLVHFTRLENLDTILKHGLMSRPKLEANNIAYEYNDSYRYDRVSEAVCLSISFPNYKMFYRCHKSNPQTGWVMLFLKPEILWEKKCLFCYTNAASNEISYLSKESRMGLNGLKSMFDHPTLRRSPNLEPYYTTDPQAEVLVLETIEKEYINTMLVHNDYSGENSSLIKYLIDQYGIDAFLLEKGDDGYFSWPN